MPTLFAEDSACGHEPMFCHRICRPDGLAPNKKGKARNMTPTGLMSREPSLAISVTRTHAANSAGPIRRYRVASAPAGSSVQRRRHVREVRTMSLTDSAAHAASGTIKPTSNAMDQLCVNTIRTLAMDAVQAANSGHPGTPMALAPVVYCLWQRVLRFDPSHPIWPNRDRFVLSVGHASMLLYAML